MLLAPSVSPFAGRAPWRCDCLSGANDGGGLYAKISGNDISSDNDISNSSLSLAAVTASNNTAGKTLSSFVQSIVR